MKLLYGTGNPAKLSAIKRRPRYKNAICFVLDEEHIYEAMDASMESGKFIITDTPHSAVKKKGFPIDSLSIDPQSGQYFYDMPACKLDQIAAWGMMTVRTAYQTVCATD